MRRIIFLLFFVACATLLSSCINIIEEMTVDKKGAGSYDLSVDMSSIMEMGMLGDLLKQGESSGLKITTPLGGKVEKDTVIYLKNSLSAAAKAKTGRPEFWDKVKMTMNVSEAKKKLGTTFHLDFDNIDDVGFFLKNINTVMAEGMGDSGKSMLPPGLLPTLAGFKFSKKSLERLPAPKSDAAASAGDEMEMMKMFLGTAKFTSIINLPGKVRKANLPNSKIDGTTVTTETPILDFISGKAKIDGNITFK
jgi:hypothetical protein